MDMELPPPQCNVCASKECRIISLGFYLCEKCQAELAESFEYVMCNREEGEEIEL